MQRNVQKNGLVNLLALLAVGAAAFITARYTHALAGEISSVFLGLGAVIALVSWFQMRLEETERLEKFEIEELARTKGDSTLFESKESELFPARRSREQFEKFFVPTFTAILFIVELAGAILLWRWLSKAGAVVVLYNPLTALPLFALFFLVLFLLGRFSATIARLEDQRLLRPSANNLLLGAYLSLVAAAGIAGVAAEFPKADLYVARALVILLGLIAIETLISLILEMYRPRLKGRVARPLYDSRLAGLLAQPESLFTTAAHALDYQFGFKISETWFFQLVRKNLPVLLLVQLALLLLSTCVVFIEAGEQGVLERYGRTVEGRPVLEPGAHFKLPWPVDQVYRYRTEQIQTVNVGFADEDEGGHDEHKTILWTVAHTKEDNFLVANRETEAVEKTTGSTNETRKAPPVSLLSVSIPVQYQITNVLAWAYKNEDPADILHSLATREVVRYLASVDLNDIMSHGRLEATEVLRDRIQASAVEQELGAKITFVGLQDIHPPIKVAPDYEKVVANAQIKLARILTAQAEAIRTNAQADAVAFQMVNDAHAARQRLEVNAIARAVLFTNQLPAFAAAPSVYKQRVYFQTFARATAQASKYVLLATNTQDVIIFDLQNKIRTDLTDLTAGGPPQK